MNTDREENHGEYWPSPFAITFNVKKVWAWLLTFFLISGTCYGQVSYCGVDVNKDVVPNGGVAKQTLSNLITYSEQIDNAAWTKTRCAVTANDAVAPDGATTAEKVTANAGAATIYAFFPAAITVVTATSYRMSIYAKAGTSSYFRLQSQVPTTAGIGVDLSTGAIGSTDTSVTSSSIKSVGNGWYKISFTYTTTGVTDYVTWYFTDSSYNKTFSAAGTETVYVWGASLQLASDPPDYLATTTTALTLGPLCPVGYTQSLTDPSRCFIVGPVTSRTIRTW